ncbi:MAG TPA: FimV/HubP family polar landmark protein [Gammaproteobacteria bacterium]|nr:FimV/HubP family polar landmark protein [Gammaproteobacteria bacterium]
MRKHTWMIAVVALAVLLPGLALPLGLGPIHSTTRIGQPLEARIAIIGADSATPQGLVVTLADASAHRQAGLSEPDFLFHLKFAVKQDASGTYVLVSSQQPVTLPFLNLLIHASWGNGELTRQYTLLLNPPAFASGGQGAAAGTPAAPPAAAAASPSPPVPAARTVAVQSSATAEPVRLAPPKVEASPTIAAASVPPVADSSDPESAASASLASASPLPPAAIARSSARSTFVRSGSRSSADAPAAKPAPAEPAIVTAAVPVSSGTAEASPSSPGTFGPVTYGSTLWSIASQLRPAGVSVKQMMMALYHANPQAFAGNIYRLYAGVKLRIPAADDIRLVSSSEAADEVAAQEHARRSAAPAPLTTGIAAVAAVANASAQPAASAALAATEAANSATAKTTAGVAVAAAVGATAAATARSVAASAVAASAAGSAAAIAGAMLARGGASNAASAAAAGSLAIAAVQGNPPGKPAGATHPQAGGAAGLAGSAAPQSVPAGARAQGTIQNWLNSPKGWIVIALIVLLLIILAVYFLHRRSAARDLEFAREPAAPASVATMEDAADQPVAAVAKSEEPAGESLPIEVAAPIVAPSPQPIAASWADDSAARLREALAVEPGRQDLRRKLLELLFAAEDREGFRVQAQRLHDESAGEGSDWDAVAAMGRQLLPGDGLFAQDAPSHWNSVAAEGAEAMPTGFAESAAMTVPGDGSENVRDEFSSFVENYVPGARTPANPPEGEAGGEDDDGAFEREGYGEIPESSRAAAAAALAALLASAPAEPSHPDGEGRENAKLRLDLARAYLKLGYPNAAREVLEEVLGEVATPA